MDAEKYIDILKKEVRPALGCTEPIAVAYAAATARGALGKVPKAIDVQVSGNVLKNAMGVGIPGTRMKGVDIAAALGALAGNADLKLEVLNDLSGDDVETAEQYVKDGKVKVDLADTDEKLYIYVKCSVDDDSGEALIRKTHTNIAFVKKNGELLAASGSEADGVQAEDGYGVSFTDIYEFADKCPIEKLEFLREGIKMNWDMAEYGLEKKPGLAVGSTIFEGFDLAENPRDLYNYASAMAAAAADARMTGMPFPVMSTAGSGNHGITTVVPVAAVAKRLHCSDEKLLRAVALSDLVTVLVKESIGKLSAMCGCGIGASIGACCGMLYLQDASPAQMCDAAKNIVADVSGIVCDGAKQGCALKIATAVSSAGRCAMLALKKHVVGSENGIVGTSFETTMDNLGKLVHDGMRETTGTIETPAEIIRSCEDSLRRLHTDYIDIFLFHLDTFPVERTDMVLSTLEQLVKVGKIRAYGWSTADPVRARVFARGAHCGGFMHVENVMEDQRAMINLCAELELTGLGRTPLCMGLLTGKYNKYTVFSSNDLRGKVDAAPWMTYFVDGKPNAELLAKLDSVREILTSNNRTLAQGCLAWVWARSERLVPVCGFRNEKQVQENFAAMEKGPLTAEQMREINALLGIDQD